MIQEAHNAYNSGDYTKAFELYTELSEQGNEEAQTSLAYMYQNAQGSERNIDKAVELYKAAAENKQPYALYNLALFYANGQHGIPFDQYKAHELFMESAIREAVPAMYEVGVMFEKGLGCICNFSEAAFWYEEAAKRGHPEAFNNLGVLYKDGHGVSQDDKRAFICFSRSADAGLKEGIYNLGLMYDQGLGCEEDHDKALDLCRKAAYQGHEKAKEIIKSLQENGKIVF
ncbi:MAG: tetratricopeptide repeat protein [Thiovulaceae bacterium]|nr:tetratricopeptide repeat protein [Sulfurimonadaceae bacterium]